MLVLGRHRDESIVIFDHIIITIVDIRGDKCRLGITADVDIPVHRQEVFEQIQREQGGRERLGCQCPTCGGRGVVVQVNGGKVNG